MKIETFDTVTEDIFDQNANDEIKNKLQNLNDTTENKFRANFSKYLIRNRINLE